MTSLQQVKFFSGLRDYLLFFLGMFFLIIPFSFIFMLETISTCATLLTPKIIDSCITEHNARANDYQTCLVIGITLLFLFMIIKVIDFKKLNQRRII